MQCRGTQRDLGVSYPFDPPAECRRWRRLPAPPHRRVRDRARADRLQRRARRPALQRHPAIQGDARLHAGRSRLRPIRCRCTDTRGTGPLQRPSARRGQDGHGGRWPRKRFATCAELVMTRGRTDSGTGTAWASYCFAPGLTKGHSIAVRWTWRMELASKEWWARKATTVTGQ